MGMTSKDARMHEGGGYCREGTYLPAHTVVLPFKSYCFWPPKKAGIFEFLEFLKVVRYESAIGPYNIHIWEKFISDALLGIMGYFCQHVRRVP